MNDAVPVSRIEAGRDAPLQQPHIVVGERPALDQLGQRLTIDELHREIVPPDSGIARKNETSDHYVMLDLVERGGFFAKQRERGFVVYKVGAHHLDGDRQSGFDRVALVDFAHAA
jgi:hypothetical protein